MQPESERETRAATSKADAGDLRGSGDAERCNSGEHRCGHEELGSADGGPVWLPWSDSCFVCGDSNPKGLGVRFAARGDEVELETEIDPAFEGFPGHLHGGVITALLDEAAGWACSMTSGRLFVTVELKLSFRRPVPGGTLIRVRGRSEGRQGRVWLGHSWIEDREGTVLASAEGVFFPVADEMQDRAVEMLKVSGRPAQASDISPRR